MDGSPEEAWRGEGMMKGDDGRVEWCVSGRVDGGIGEWMNMWIGDWMKR